MRNSGQALMRDRPVNSPGLVNARKRCRCLFVWMAFQWSRAVVLWMRPKTKDKGCVVNDETLRLPQKRTPSRTTTIRPQPEQYRYVGAEAVAVAYTYRGTTPSNNVDRLLSRDMQTGTGWLVGWLQGLIYPSVYLTVSI